MSDTDVLVWGIHAGKTGDAHSLFMNHNVIAIGWVPMGDLSKIPADRESFKQLAVKVYPEKNQVLFQMLQVSLIDSFMN